MTSPRKSGCRVGLFGLLGQGNLGNDGSLEAVLAYLRKAHPDVILDALCSGPTLVSERYAMPATRLRWFDTNAPRGGGLDGLVRRCLELGAGKPGFQPGGDRWTVLTDPSGHPFCLAQAG